MVVIEKKIDFWVRHIDELNTLWNNAEITAASVKKRYFSGKKYLGSKDKKVVGGCFYFSLRTRLFTETVSIHELLYLAYLHVTEVKESVDKLLKNIDILEFISSYIDSVEDLVTNFDAKKNTFFFPQVYLENIYSKNVDLNELCKSLNEEATTDLRILSNRDVIEEELTATDIPYSRNLLNGCLKLKKNINFNNYISYKNGYFDIQDEGSQLVSYFLNPMPDDSILDYCSGGGGKTLHIAELAEDRANIVATDIDIKRLKETERRVSFHRYASVRIMNKEDVDSDTKQYDKILVDAPCSGSGTVRRSPDIRYSITADSISTYAALQLEILEKCYSKLNVGGELVYSTCSLFTRENDDVVLSFLKNHNDITQINIRDRVIGLQLDPDRFDFTDAGLMTMTHKTNTDGFYISVLTKEA